MANPTAALLPPAAALKLASANAANEGNFAASIVMARKAIALDPGEPAVRTNLGLVFWMMERYAEAEREFLAALDMGPHADRWRAYMGLAQVCRATGNTEHEIQMLHHAINSPQNDAHLPELHAALGYALLTSGAFVPGLGLLKERWSGPATHIWGLGIPQWEGDLGKLRDRRVLVHHHQGLGDTIQFCRFLQVLRRAGAYVIAVMPRELVRLIDGANLADEVADLHGIIPPADMHVPIGLLPLYAGLNLSDLPVTKFPYLLADGMIPFGEWDFLHFEKTFKIGIAWSANRRSETGNKRSIPLEALLSLAEIPNVSLYALQPNAATDIAAAGAESLVEDLGWALRDLADTAAYMRQMDLVISADSAPLHLAGALGLPCIGLLSYAFADWRWLEHGRTDSPWYPSMQLVRQRRPGRWKDVVDRATLLVRSMMGAATTAAAAD